MVVPYFIALSPSIGVTESALHKSAKAQKATLSIHLTYSISSSFQLTYGSPFSLAFLDPNNGKPSNRKAKTTAAAKANTTARKSSRVEVGPQVTTNQIGSPHLLTLMRIVRRPFNKRKSTLMLKMFS